jgi:hypothetical protein
MPIGSNELVFKVIVLRLGRGNAAAAIMRAICIMPMSILLSSMLGSARSLKVQWVRPVSNTQKCKRHAAFSRRELVAHHHWAAGFEETGQAGQTEPYVLM